MSAPIVLVAASGLAREAVAACRRPGSNAGPLLGYLDDDPAKAGTTIDGLPVLGGVADATNHPDAAFVVCAGKGASRRSIVARLAELGIGADRYATVIDPSVYVPATCAVGGGSILLAGTVLTTGVQVGAHVVCMPNVVLPHDDVLDDFATLAAGVVLGGNVRIGEAAYLGMNASVREHLHVGAEATLGMGSVLLADQPAHTTWAGVPAKEIATKARS